MSTGWVTPLARVATGAVEQRVRLRLGLAFGYVRTAAQQRDEYRVGAVPGVRSASPLFAQLWPHRHG